MLNNMGVDPNEWFDDYHLPENGYPTNPLDSMPIATDSPITDDVKYDNKYANPEKLSELESMNPRPEEEIADWFDESDTYASRHESTPDFEKSAEEVVTIHEKMYRMARSKYNPFAVGGSENIHDFDSAGGSEEAHK